MILEAVTEDNLRAVVEALIEKAKAGDVMADLAKQAKDDAQSESATDPTESPTS